LQKAGSIDPDSDKLDIDPYSPTDDFSNLDFRQTDRSDPLGVHTYIHTNPLDYIQNHISTIYSVRYGGKLAGYFTLSMSNIGKKDMLREDAIAIHFLDYPALLLGQMGVDRNYRGRQIGEKICSFCRGIAQDINEKAACAFLILRTTTDLARGYYEPYCHFKWKPKEEGKVWMYRKLF
jgi:hypothetical protein